MTCVVDGKSRAIKKNAKFSGKRIVIEKIHTLYKFKGRAVLVMTPEGFLEYQELRTTAALNDLHNTYFFMHPWVPTTAKYLIRYHDGHEEKGSLIGKKRVSFRRIIKTEVNGKIVITGRLTDEKKS